MSFKEKLAKATTEISQMAKEQREGNKAQVKELLEKTLANVSKINSADKMREELYRLKTKRSRLIKTIGLETSETTIAELANAATMPNVHKLTASSITLITPNITLYDPETGQDFFFGKFTIEFHYKNQWYRGECEPENHQTANWSGDRRYCHPHISEDNICMGAYSAVQNKALERGDIPSAYECCLSVLESYYPEDSYKRLDVWNRLMCTCCDGNWASGECENCGTEICENCCNENWNICYNCAEKCENCGERTLENLLVCSTESCENKICRGCEHENHTCQACYDKEIEKTMVIIEWEYAC